MNIKRYTAIETGSVQIVLLMFFPLLLVMAGLGADIGKLYVAKSELQNAADACALAAAAQFDSTADQITNATNAGNTVAKLNNVVFQKNAVAIENVNITFPTSLNGVAGTYVQCDITSPNITNWITPILNLIGGNVSDSEIINARAVATTIPGQTTCAIPVAICQTQLAGINRGDWIEGIIGPSKSKANDDETEPGNFKWVDLTPANAGGASEIAGILNGSNSTSCNVSVALDTDIGKSGFNGNARKAYNTRFGLKENPGDTTPAIHVTGKGYYLVGGATNPGRFDSLDYANAVQAHSPYTDISDIKINPLRLSTNAEHAAGNPDSRVATTAVVDCTTMKLKSFACVFMLHPLPTTNASSFKMYLEYLGNPATDITPCNPTSVAGTGIGPKVSTLVR
ncbi:MAG: pilus assembly protein TadG-related protein [Pseudomonadota bacterium]